jgi:putative transposase
MTKPFDLSDLQFFDRNRDYSVVNRRLPHWAQTSTVCFITWRTADSLPKSIMRQLFLARCELLVQHGFQPNSDWTKSTQKLTPHLREQLQWSAFNLWDAELDHGRGACQLKEQPLAQIVMQSLRHFDESRYVLTDAVVMPNHVHLLVAFCSEHDLLQQCCSWKRFTATRINRWLKAQHLSVPSDGTFWQPEQFDHLVRNHEQFLRLRTYIRDNPRNAGLPQSDCLHYSRS